MGMRRPRVPPDQLPPVSLGTMLKDLRSTLALVWEANPLQTVLIATLSIVQALLPAVVPLDLDQPNSGHEKRRSEHSAEKPGALPLQRIKRIRTRQDRVDGEDGVGRRRQDLPFRVGRRCGINKSDRKIRRQTELTR